ncbi:UreD-domain-containing protein [Geranomyces variabilis]|nr:UreD-domain-containing protein [Geranomyces variabilis]
MSTTTAAAATDSPPARAGVGHISCVFRNPRTILTQLAFAYPLRLLAPRAHSRSAAAYALTFGGGLLSGDRITLNVSLAPHTSLALLTQGSTKVFPRKTAGETGVSAQTLVATVAASALLALLPDPTTLFAGAAYVQNQTVRCDSGASLCLLDWYTAGRASRGERWEFESYETVNEVWVDSVCVVRDAWLLEDDRRKRTYAERMGAYECFANVILLGPRLERAAQSVAAASTTTSTAKNVPASASPAAAKDLIWSASPIPNCEGGIVVRAASLDTQAMRRFLAEVVLKDLEVELGERWFSPT